MAVAQVTDCHERAVGAIYDAVLEPESMPRAIGAIAEATGAMGGMLGVFELVSGHGHAPSVAGLDLDLLELFEQRFTLNPWTRAVVRHAAVGVTHSSETYVDARDLRATEFHDAILAPQGIVGQSFLLLRQDGLFTIGLSLMHREIGHSARCEVLRTQDRIGAHLARALEIMRRLETMRARLDTREQALEHQRCAVFVLDRSALIRYANARARRLLVEADGLISTRRLLSARHYGDGLRLAECIRSVFDGLAEKRVATMSIHRGVSRLPLLAIVMPRRAEGVEFHDPRRLDSVLLFVTDPSERGTVAAEILRAAFGLTEREVGVALAAGRLAGVPAVAAELGIAPTTARTHLQHVFDKTGARTQVALAQLLEACGVLPQADAAH